MKDRRDFWERLDLPGETMPGQVLVEITEKNRVLVEHHRGVLEYSREKIGIHVKFGRIVVTGSGLQLRRMSAQQLIICGEIDAVMLCRRE